MFKWLYDLLLTAIVASMNISDVYCRSNELLERLLRRPNRLLPGRRTLFDATLSGATPPDPDRSSAAKYVLERRLRKQKMTV